MKAQLYLILPYILATMPSTVFTEVTVEVTRKVTVEVKAEVTATVTAEVPADVPAVETDGLMADGEWQWVEALGQSFQKEIQAVKQPIEEAIIEFGFSSCEQVQKFFGISYEQMKGEKAPDLNTLALHYKTKYSTTIINITSAPEALSRVRRDRDPRLIIFVHGFTDDPTQVTTENLTRSFFIGNHLSVMALDASPLIRWLYYRSSTYVRFIGQKLAEVLAAIVHHGQDPSLIHLIGYSLGAHIAGIAGKHFFKLTKTLIGRISGLDPAGPCFNHMKPDHRLTRTDAIYVDVMHTDLGVFGIKHAIGHKDYYPNGGSMQPNCLRTGCSHGRTCLLYGESVVNQLAFPAVRCKDWDAFKTGKCDPDISYMGYGSKPGGADGMYFLQTGGSYPYGKGLEGTRYKHTETNGVAQAIGSFLG